MWGWGWLRNIGQAQINITVNYSTTRIEFKFHVEKRVLHKKRKISSTRLLSWQVAVMGEQTVSHLDRGLSAEIGGDSIVEGQVS